MCDDPKKHSVHAPFHCHPSSIDSGSNVDRMVDQSKALGSGYAVITDHGFMGDCLKHFHSCKKAGIKPILGLEGYFKDKNCPIIKDTESADFKYFHFTVHFKDQLAYQAACRILSDCDRHKSLNAGGERKPIFEWCDLEELATYNITMGSGCLIGMVSRHIIAGREDLAEAYYVKLRELVGPDDWFVELSPHICDHYWQNNVKITLANGETFKVWDGAKFDTKAAKGVTALQIASAPARHNFIETRYIRRSPIPINQEVAKVEKVKGFIKQDEGDIQLVANKFCLKMAKKYGDRCLISDDAHYAIPEDKVVQNSLLGENFRFYGDYSLLKTSEVLKYYKESLEMSDEEVDALVENSHTWASKFDNFDLKYEYRLPTPEDEPMKLIMKSIKELGRFDSSNPEAVRRLRWELDVFANNGVVNILPYFFPIQKVLDHYKKNNELVGPSRGSAGSSLLCYLIGITQLDPLKYNLPFERFFSLDRIQNKDLPDIDVDLPHRDLLVGEDGNSGILYDTWGEKAAQISTRILLRLKSSIIDANRFVNKGEVEEEIEEFAKQIKPPPQGISDQDYVFGYDSEDGHRVAGLLEMSEDLQKYAVKRPKEWEIVKRSLGVSRQNSRHACFAAGTLVDNNGRVEVIEKATYSVDNPIKTWSTGIRDTISVTMSNGISIRCTPDHVFICENGEEVEARNLIGKNVQYKPFSNCSGDIDSFYLSYDINAFGHGRNVIIDNCTNLKNSQRLPNVFWELSLLNQFLLVSKIASWTDKIRYISISLASDICTWLHSIGFDTRLFYYDDCNVDIIILPLGQKEDRVFCESIQYEEPCEVFDFNEPTEHMGHINGCLVHNSAFVIADIPIKEVVPTFTVGDVPNITQYDAKMVEKAGLIKYDFLCVSSLKDIGDCLKAINKKNGDEFEIGTFKHNGVKTYIWDLPNDVGTNKMIGAGKAETVFQINTNSMAPFIKRIKPKSIMDLATILALVRPGPMDFIDPVTGRSMAEEYMWRREGRSKGDIEILNKLLPESYGIIVFQESLGLIAKTMANFEPQKAEKLRKLMCKKQMKALEAMKPDFINGSLANGYSQHEVETVWEMMVKFGQYGFSIIHSVGYSLITYACAFLKHNYTLEWWAAVLSNATDIEIRDKFFKFVKEIVSPPDINLSTERMAIDYETGTIRSKLSMISGLGETMANKITNGRPFKDLEDFIQKKICGPALTRRLIYVGVLDSLLPKGMDTVQKLQYYEDMCCQVEFDTKKAKGTRTKFKEPKKGVVDMSYIGLDKLADFVMKKSILPFYPINLTKFIHEYAPQVIRVGERAYVQHYDAKYIMLDGDAFSKFMNIQVSQRCFLSIVAYVHDFSIETYQKTKKRLELTIDVDGFIIKLPKWPDYNTGKLEYPSDLKKGSVILLYLERREMKDNVIIREMSIIR